MDAVAVEAVIEVNADCADRARAEAVLAEAVATARAPRRSTEAGARWRVEMQVAAAAPGIKSADAQIRDDSGLLVAERSVSDKTTGSCVALARAVSAWAQIVLDDELVRAVRLHDDTRETRPDTRAEARPSDAERELDRAWSSVSPHRPVDVDTAAEGVEPKPPFEIGTMLFLRNGVAATGGVFGASPFVTVGLSRAFIFRPSLMIGTSLSRVPTDPARSADPPRRMQLNAFGMRLDLCRRLPGNYIARRGIELDACAGADVAYVVSDLNPAFRASVGPSAILRGELGSNIGLEIRGMFGANLVRAGFGADASFFVAAAELGGSVRFR